MKPYTQFDINNPPPPLMTGEPNSFAYRTITTRIPAVVQTILDDHKSLYPSHIVSALESLHQALIQGQPFAQLKNNAFDYEQWHQAYHPYQGRSWHDIPWYLAEALFYRQVLEAVDYFGASEWAGVDPFLPRKQAELAGDTAWQVLESALSAVTEDEGHSFCNLLEYGLWGNRADLSYTEVMNETGGQIVTDNEADNLLVDDAEQVLQYLQKIRKTNRRLDFICDNAGTELITDLVLVDFLLRFEWVDQITLHVKAYPTFVSDTIPADIEQTLEKMAAKENPEFVALANRLAEYLTCGAITVQDNPFWNSPYFFWQLPAELHSELSQAGLVIIKGDANYRRLLGDSQWPTTVSAADAIPYFPTPFVCLRTLKSDPIVGLSVGLAESLDQKDSNWRINGKRGVIQAVINPS